MTTDRLYGIRSTDLERTRQEIEAALGVSFLRHESDYRGGDYFRCDESPLGALILQRNIDLIENVPAVEKFSQWPVLLYTFGLADSSPINVLQSKFHGEYVLLPSKTSSND